MHLIQIKKGRSFAVPKRSGRTNDATLTEVLDTLAAWIDQVS